MKTQEFNRVLICSIYKRDTRIPVRTEEEYMNQFKLKNKNQGGLCEIVGLDEYQVKPYFDVDGKDKNNEGFDESIIDKICGDIQEICNNDIYIGNREAREENGVVKYSYRLYLKARISYKNVPILFKDVFDKYSIIDKSVYNPNRILFTPLSDRKKDLDVPPLINIKGSIFDCCASYILEDYEDLDSKIPVIEVPKPVVKIVKEADDDEDETPDKYNRVSSLIDLLSSSRSENFESWIKFCWCLINICNKEKISRRKCSELIHKFSKLSKTNYNEDEVDNWIDTNYDKINETG